MNRPIPYQPGLLSGWLAWCLTLCPLSAAILNEDFDSDPQARGWQVAGDSSLFHWNEESEMMDVTWDSSRPNSYFYKTLGTVLTQDDDFSLGFDLILDAVTGGVNPEKPFTFEVSLGLIHLASATNAAFMRGRASGVRNIVEYDYFPAFEYFGATMALTMVASNRLFAYSHNFPREMPAGDRFRIEMDYSAASRTLAAEANRNGSPEEPLDSIILPDTFPGFVVDALAISSYSDTNANGSILAHGRVDNFFMTLPNPPLTRIQGQWTNGHWQVTFLSQSNWIYTLERSLALPDWQALGVSAPGNGTSLTLVDPTPQPGPVGFYRVRADRP